MILVNCEFDFVCLYSDTNGLELGVKRPLSALSDATDGRLVGSANVARSSDEVASWRPWKKRRIAVGEASEACPCEICGSKELLSQCVICGKRVCYKNKFWCAPKGCDNKFCR